MGSANASVVGKGKRTPADGEPNYESIEEKKERLFKWQSYQSVRFSQDLIKDTLLQNVNVLRFLNLLETFESTLLVWGSNESLQFGLSLRRNLQRFY